MSNLCRSYISIFHHLRSQSFIYSEISNRLKHINRFSTLAPPKNEPILDYNPKLNSSHQRKLNDCLREFTSQIQEIPIVIKGREYQTNEVRYQKLPFEHKSRIAKFYYATPELIDAAVEAALDSKKEWQLVPVEHKLKIFEKAADLVSGKYRQHLNAATMLGQAKTIKQAEIDAAAELADFLRFNSYYLKELMAFGKPISTDHEMNSTRFLGLDGFVAAISPFNFTAIAGNLATAPALMNNCVVWKPSDTAILSNFIILKILREAGFPDGVINFVPSEGFNFGRIISGNKKLAGLNFTGSLATFQWLWSEIGLNIKQFDTFPRLIGECGGKNFHLIHKSADIDSAIAQTIRSAFEYSGQKCSACSRLYVPVSIWNGGMKEKLVDIAKNKLKIGPATDYSSYTSAVIDAKAYNRITSYLSYVKASQPELKILCGGGSSDEIGYFIEPTIIETNNPTNRLMREELFGPVLTVYPYNENSEEEKILDLIDANPFALTGSVFSQDESFIESVKRKLSLGNLYINDKSTGAVVGQQPFGGWRHSGTNDKAGGPHYLMRWCNQQTVKRTKKGLLAY